MIDSLAFLKQHTLDLHRALEQVSFAQAIMAKEISLTQYAQLLRKNHLIYQQLEAPLNKQLQQMERPILQQFASQRFEDLEKDLATFPVYHTADLVVPPFSILNKTLDLAAYLGILYVLEGARLGGKVIVKALRENENLKALSQFNFYQQTDILIGHRWRNFRQIAQEQLQSTADLERAGQTARATFSYFKTIHQQNFAPPHQ